jgi:hypothetical protein
MHATVNVIIEVSFLRRNIGQLVDIINSLDFTGLLNDGDMNRWRLVKILLNSI